MKNEKMLIPLNTQADLEEAIHALVKQDPRLKPVFELAGMPALRRRDPGYAGLAALICGQQLFTASAAAISAPVAAAFAPFHHGSLRPPRAHRRGASVVGLLQGDEKARGRDRRRARSERCFKQDTCCKTVIGKSKDRGRKTAGIEKMKSTDFVVARNDLQQCKFIETQLPDVLPDEALLIKIDRFAFTANNITYAVLGDQLKYWHLFPAPENFGNIPVCGFGEVVASRHPGLSEGERLFGYFPMAMHLVIEAADVSKRGLRDAAAHRQGVAPVYNAYARISGDPAFAGRQGDYQALLRPLFMLSFLVDDFLAENEFYGARSVMLSSASRKPAFGLAHLLHLREGINVIGLTSASTAKFVESLGCYDEVIAYDRVQP